MTARGPLRLAHRGDWRLAPENSLAAVAAALRAPACDGIEFDVRASRDGIPVVVHDPSLARVQGMPDRVADLGVEELRRHGIPTLAEVLAAAPLPAFLEVELKEDIGRSAVALIEAARGDPPIDAVVSSFGPATIATVRSLRPAWPCWLNSKTLGPGTIGLARELGCTAVAVEWHAIDARSVARTRDAGLEVVAWTLRRPSTITRLAQLGVIAMCIDGPALNG